MVTVEKVTAYGRTVYKVTKGDELVARCDTRFAAHWIAGQLNQPGTPITFTEGGC